MQSSRKSGKMHIRSRIRNGTIERRETIPTHNVVATIASDLRHHEELRCATAYHGGR